MAAPEQITSNRPYVLRALYEWCSDNGLTPHIAVAVDESVVVPGEYVKDGQIVLNISMDSVHALHIDNDALTLQARFGGVARDLYVPVGRVVAFFARENGQGMSFLPEETPAFAEEDEAEAGESELAAESEDHNPEPPKPPTGTRPTLRLVK